MKKVTAVCGLVLVAGGAGGLSNWGAASNLETQPVQTDVTALQIDDLRSRGDALFWGSALIAVLTYGGDAAIRNISERRRPLGDELE